MKTSRIFALVMVGLFALGFLIEINIPKSFVWYPTYHTADRQPFGCYVFDSIMKQTMPGRYKVSNKTFWQLNHAKQQTLHSYLVLAENPDLDSVDVEQMLKLVRRGNKIMLVVEDQVRSYALVDMVGIDFESNYNHFNLGTLQDSIKAKSTNLSADLEWTGKNSLFPERTFSVYSQMLNSSVTVDSSGLNPKVLLIRKSPIPQEQQDKMQKQVNTDTLALSVKYGTGEIIYCSSALLFTNYGILDNHCRPLVLRLMSLLSDYPVIRTQAYMDTPDQIVAHYSPLRELLKRPPLRWALYLALFGILLFLCFTARRRQRIIPVITPPRNKSLEFVKLIGTLYYHKRQNTELVRKKCIYFAEVIRHQLNLDIMDTDNNEYIYERLARQTGIELAEIEKTIREVRFVYYLEDNISFSEMRNYINGMNRILKAL